MTKDKGWLQGIIDCLTSILETVEFLSDDQVKELKARLSVAKEMLKRNGLVGAIKKSHGEGEQS